MTGEANQVLYVSFAQVQDIRGTNAEWDLQVRMIDFEATNADEVNYLKLMPNASAVSVMTAEKDKGAGVSSVVWGNQANLDAQEADDATEVVTNNAIQLFVPGSTAKDATQYKSTLTWKLSNTPDNGGEDGGDQSDGNDAYSHYETNDFS